MAVPLFLRLSQAFSSIARRASLDALFDPVPNVEREFMATKLYRLSKAGSVNVIDLTLPQTLDIDEFDRLNDSLLERIRSEAEGQWVLDLSQVSYMGSAALGLLVNLRQQIKQTGGRLVLCGLSQQLTHVFKTCCMERLFKITKSRKDAIAAAC
jgi:anti-anti-sigma factor